MAGVKPIWVEIESDEEPPDAATSDVPWPFILMGCVVLIVLAVASIAPAIVKGGWIEPDEKLYARNPVYQSYATFGVIWTLPTAAMPYWPVSGTSYLIERAARPGRLAPSSRLPRVVNALIHAAGAIALWRMLTLLGVRWAWVSAAFFVSLPASGSTVLWASARPVVLSTALTFAAIWMLLRPLRLTGLHEAAVNPDAPWRPRWRWYAAAGWLAAAAAVLAGPCGLAVVPLLGVLLWRRGRRVSRLEWVALAAAAVPAVVMSFVWMRQGQWQRPVDTDVTKLATMPWAYVAGILWPGWITPDLELREWRWTGAASAAATAMIAVLAAGWTMRDRIGRWPLAAAGAFLVLLLPTLVGLRSPLQTAGDFWMPAAYAAAAVPMAGLGVATAGISRGRTWRPRPLAAAVIAAVIVTLASASAWTSGRLHDSASQLRLAQQRRPNSSTVQARVAAAELSLDKPDLTRAETAARAAIRAAPERVAGHLALARVYQRRGDRDAASSLIATARRLDPADVEAMLLEADLLSSSGKSDTALSIYSGVLARPSVAVADRVKALSQRALLREQRGEAEAAEADFREAIRLDGQAIDARINLAISLFRRGTSQTPVNGPVIEEAARQVQAVLELEPGNAKAWANLGVMAAVVGRQESAIDYLRVAVSLDPDEPSALLNLARVLLTAARQLAPNSSQRLRLLGDAAVCATKASQLVPSDPAGEQLLDAIAAARDESK